MNIKIKYHLMPWEIDYALLTFTQLKKSSFYLQPDDKIYIDVGFNLSNYFIDWNKSKLPKEFFINKFNTLIKLLDWAEVKTTIYEGNDIWGHLNLEKNQIESHIDYYISICPDMWFHEHLLYYLLESAKQVKDKYFIITPEIHKLWDSSWDELVNDKYQNVSYNDWNKSDIFEIQNVMSTLDEPYLKQINNFKWAGWFDLYSKDFIEELLPIPEEWNGYGPWDFYGMLCSDIAKKEDVNIKEYVLKNQIIFEYHPDKDNKSNFVDYYKDLLVLNKTENQRQIKEARFPQLINQWVEYAKNKGIIKIS
jgi:hypothetical protein